MLFASGPVSKVLEGSEFAAPTFPARLEAFCFKIHLDVMQSIRFASMFRLRTQREPHMRGKHCANQVRFVGHDSSILAPMLRCFTLVIDFASKH